MMESDGSTAVSPSNKSPKHVFYFRLSQILREGGFDKHMAALCKPFISNSTAQSWWSSTPSSYFRILFVGYLEGIESEAELCWRLDESLILREFAGFDANASVPDATTLAQIRQPLLPLIHSEAFDILSRLIEKTGLLEGRVPAIEPAWFNGDGPLAAVAQRIRSKDHQSYWKRLTRTSGASWVPRASFPAPARASTGPVISAARPLAPFALWSEDLSLAQSEFEALRGRGIRDFKTYFAENESSAVDHVVRACIFGRGPTSVHAYLSANAGAATDLPQGITPEAIAGCKAIAAALAEGTRQIGVEFPMAFDENRSAIVSLQIAVRPGFEATLASVLVAYTVVSGRVGASRTADEPERYVAETLERCRIGVWEWDVANDMTRWSDAMLRIYGLSRDDFSGRHSDYADFTHPDDREAQNESVRQSIIDGLSPNEAARPHTEGAPAFEDFRIRRKDGQIRWVRGSAVELVDDTGRPVKMQGVLWDVTRSKVAELQVIEGERRFRAMAECAALPVVIETFDGEVVYANDSALQFFQIGRDELPRLLAADYWEDAEQRASALSTLAENGELRSFETRFRMGSDHEPRVALMAARVIEYDGRNVILCHHQEITYSKCIEEQLRSGKQEAEMQLQLAAERTERLERELEARLEASQADHLARLGEKERELAALQKQSEERLASVRDEIEQRLQTTRSELQTVRTRELSLIERVSALSESDPAQILAISCRELARAFDLPLTLAALLQTDTARLEVVAEHGVGERATLVGRTLALTSVELASLFAGRPQPIWIGEAATDDRASALRDLLTFDPQPAVLLAPLVVQSELVGLFVLGTGSDRVFDAAALGLVGSVSTHVARLLGALRMAAAHQRLSSTLERIRELVDATRPAPHAE